MLLLSVRKLELGLKLANGKKSFVRKWNLLLQLLVKANVSECWLINVKTWLKVALDPFGISMMLLVFNSYGLLESLQTRAKTSLVFFKHFLKPHVFLLLQDI